MKLKNKKTGQEGNFIINKDHFECVDLDYVPEYKNLAKLNEEWEDYTEEPKGLGWRIDEYNDPEEIVFGFSLEEIDCLKEIGLWFSTKEETELAVRKLKAWRRLKDKGFKLEGWTIDDGLKISICTNFEGDNIYSESEKEIKSNLDICFGGEE